MLAVLATVAAVGVAGAVVIARSSGGTSGGHAIDEPSAEVGTMPETVRSGVIAGLSPQMRELVNRALANQTAISVGAIFYGFPCSPPVPDDPTLARALAAVPAADARGIVSGLSPEQRAELGASPVTASPAGAVCP